MNPRLRATAIAISFFGLFGVSGLRAQEKTKRQDTLPPAPAASAPDKNTAVLTDATRASTSQALASATKQKVKESTDKQSNQPEDSAVIELRSVQPGQNSKAEKPQQVSSTQKGKGGPLKNIHGTAYGRTGSTSTDNRSVGGAAGTSSKSGKTSVYVETQRTRETTPRP